MVGVGEGDVAVDPCVPLSAVGVKSLDAVLEELPVVAVLAVELPVLAVELPVRAVELPVVPVGEVAFWVLSVGPTSRSKLSEKSDNKVK